jgi:hypothetical protein
MKKSNLLLALCASIFLLGLGYANAQNFTAVKQIGGTGYDYSNGMAKDPSGDMITIGNWDGTMDFDPGAGVTSLTTPGPYSLFIAKYTAGGTLVWVKGIDIIGTATGTVRDVVTDVNGNIYITGNLKGTIDFDPGAGVANITSANANLDDIFVAKYTSNGTFSWVNKYGVGAGQCWGIAVSTDASSNVVVTGKFKGTIDFDPGAGVANLSTNGGTGSDIFLAKFTTSGSYLWAINMGENGIHDDYGRGVTVDMNNDIYVTGEFNGTSDFDGGAGVVNLVSNGDKDIYIAKYNASGNYLWAYGIGGPFPSAQDVGLEVKTSTSGDVYVTGFYQGTVDFDPGPGVVNLPGAGLGGHSSFFMKYSGAGVFQWAKAFAGPNTTDERGTDMAIDASGNVYLAGYFIGTSDFDPGAGVVNLTSVQGAGVGDWNLGKYDTNGNYVWAFKVGDGGNDFVNGLALDAANNIIVYGYFDGVPDFDPGAGTATLTPFGNADVFIGIYNTALAGGGGGVTATTGVISPGTNCAGATVSVPFTITGTYNAGNIFTAQLSDAAGSFVSPVNIGTLAGVAAGSISGVIPANTTPSGSGYKIRVIASSPTATGTSSSVTINALPVVSISGAAASYCINGADVTLTGSPAGGTFTGNGMAGNVFTPATAGLGPHTITYSYTDPNGCSGSATQNINVNAIPTVSISGLNNAYILADPTVVMTGSPAGGTFSGPGVTGSKFSPPGAGTGTHTIVYIYSDGNGCMNAICQSVVVSQFVALEEHKMGNGEMAVYPNPGNGKYTLTFDGHDQAVKIRVMNSLGQVIYIESHDQYKGMYNKTIDLSQFANGVYSLIIEMNGEVNQKSLIKQ